MTVDGEPKIWILFLNFKQNFVSVKMFEGNWKSIFEKKSVLKTLWHLNI